MNARTEGDARRGRHALACGTRTSLVGRGECWLSCRCWCHGITKHPDGSLRDDAEHEGARP